MTRESFGDQSPLVTTRAPVLLMFSVNVSSVGTAGFGLVSITATASALRFSYRPGCMAIGQVPEFLQGHIVRCWHFVARASVLPDKASMGVVFQADQGMDKPLMTGNSEVTRIWHGRRLKVFSFFPAILRNQCLPKCMKNMKKRTLTASRGSAPDSCDKSRAYSPATRAGVSSEEGWPSRMPP